MAQLGLGIPHSTLASTPLSERAYALHARAQLGLAGQHRHSSLIWLRPNCKRTVRCASEPPGRSSSDEPPDAARLKDGLSYSNRETDSAVSSSSSNLSDPRNSSGPRLTQWGGSVRGGKYQMGEGADAMLGLFGNGEVMLFAALVILSLFCVLLNFIPRAPQ